MKLLENNADLRKLLKSILRSIQTRPLYPYCYSRFPVHLCTHLLHSTLFHQQPSPSTPRIARLSLLPSLPDACLAQLIAAAGVYDAYDSEKDQFNVACHEYVELADKVKAASNAASENAVAVGMRGLGR